MSDEAEESGLTGIEPLEFLWTCSKQLVDDCQKSEFSGSRLVITEKCFRRIMLMTLSFLRLNPLSSLFLENGHWDLPSCAAIARCILETYLRMFYFGVELLDEAESLFRVRLMTYHAAFQELEIHTDSRMPEGLLEKQRRLVDITRASLEGDGYFQKLRPDWKKKLIENPSRIDLPKASERAGISAGFHHSSYEFCSAFIHGSLYAMGLTEQVNLTTGTGKALFRNLADITLAYVALSVRDFAKSFPEIAIENPRLTSLCEVWTLLVQWEKLPGFDHARSIADDLEESGE